jgi:hypothetical protein
MSKNINTNIKTYLKRMLLHSLNIQNKAYDNFKAINSFLCLAYYSLQDTAISRVQRVSYAFTYLVASEHCIYRLD